MFNVFPDSKALVRSDETIEVQDKHGFFQACMSMDYEVQARRHNDNVSCSKEC